MASRALSLSSLSSLSPISLSHHLACSTPSSLRFYSSKPIVVVNKSVQSHYDEQTPADTRVSISTPEVEGTGAAAPTRGDIFLERQKSFAAATTVLAACTKKKKKKKIDKVGGSVKVSLPSCYGCGAPLQTSETDAPGYVDPDTYQLKKKHHQLRKVICGRCRLLSHGHMVTAVGGHGGYSGGKQFVSAEELRKKLSHLRHEKALIVKLVDIVDFNGSFLGRVRDLAGANPIILVVTKVDLLPKGTNLDCVGDWVVEATMKKKLNVLSVRLTSSKSLVGIAGVVSEIQKEKKGRDVYILGAANVGKSAFISALLKMMSYKDPVAAAAQKYKPIQSAVPGTTLGPIQIDAFLGGGKLYDTPGVHLHHRQAAVVHSEDLPALAPQSRLRGQSFPNSQVALDEWTAGKIASNGLNGFSIFWGGLVRVDILKVLPRTRLTFYGPKGLQIHMVPTDKADEFYQAEVGISLTPPTGNPSNDWTGLETQRHLQIKFEDAKSPACDVAVSGLGWIAVEPVGRSPGVSDSDSEETDKELLLAVHVAKPVEVFIRPPMPAGKAGEEWYQYRELTEMEEEVRPKWYF
ncbi:putative nitric oxide synthase isoform X2 [Diospyros lotus]|uniref:putative nitric oxide synthase isoform X2 n=1 Tax=Diospyros lotus TaxID=55363 RepID=UPI0022517A64|nr:putative nitric oxide synthase isoform X2 [Diospyros lotus]